MIKINDLIEVHNIDCMDYMRGLDDNSFDLAIVDPPYGLSGAKMLGRDSSRSSGRGRANKSYHAPKTWDNARPEKAYFDELFRVSKNQIIFGGNYFGDYLPPSRGWIVWDKNNGTTCFSDGELAYTSFNRALRIFKFTWNGMMQGDMKNKEKRIHPTQKPARLYEWILSQYSKPGDRILDTHLGSGSSAVAANKMGFEFVGMELDTEYFEAAVNRMNQELCILQGAKLRPVNL